MGINRIPFSCPVYIIVTAASDIADLVQIFPVFKNSHQTGHVAFYAAFIKNVRIGKVVMGEGSVFIGDHHSDRTLIFDVAADPLMCQIASYHAFFRGKVFIDGFRLGFSFGFSGSDSALDHVVNRNGFDSILFASAAKQHCRACQTG